MRSLYEDLFRILASVGLFGSAVVLCSPFPLRPTSRGGDRIELSGVGWSGTAAKPEDQSSEDGILARCNLCRLNDAADLVGSRVAYGQRSD